MNPFLPGGPDNGIPYPPVDIPAPDTPAPDFTTIAQTFTAAAATERKKQADDSSYWDWLWRQLLKAVKAILSSILDFFTLVIGQIADILDGTHGAIDRLTTVVISAMFGAETKVGTWDNLKDAASRKQTGSNIAQIFLNALKTGQTDPNGLVPSSAGSDAFMAACAHMAVEGWLLGFVAEVAGAGQIETFAELKDIIESSLGLGRMARRVMAPPVKVFVEDPYTWLLNKTYHPTLLSPGEAVRFYLRGGIDRNGLQAIMDLHGYQSTLVDELIWDQVKTISPGDIETMRFHGDLDDAGAVQALQRLGFDNANAKNQLRAMQLNRYDAMDRQKLGEALSLLKAHRMTLLEYNNQVGLTGLAPDEQDHYKKMGVMYAANQPKFTIAEAEQLVKKGLWDLNQFRDLVINTYNYSPSDEQDLELLLLVEIKDAADAAAKKAAAASARQAAAAAKVAAAAAKAKLAAAQVEEKGVSQAQYETLVEQGLRTLQQYHDYLTSKQVAPDNADALVTVLQNKIQTKAAAAALKATAAGKAKAKNLDVAQLETAVKQGLLTVAEFTTRMEQVGMSATDAQLLAQELQGQIDSAATKAKAAADAKAAAAVKHVDLSQEERAVRLGIETPGAYAAFLDAHGFDAHSRDVLVAELQAQLDADQQTAAKKAAAAAKLSAKGISLPQLERLVRAGIKTTADYSAALAAAGYDAADQAAMTDYLQLQMEQDQQDLIVHGHAAALVGELGVSLQDLERAVKLSVVPIATYQDALNRAGISSADQQTLVANLAAEIKATRAAQSTTQSVAKQVAAAGVTLTQLERDTISGKLTIEQFQGLLAGYGVAPADVLDVVALVQDEIDNANAVKALVNQATARAAAKGLDLAQDTAAYKAGVMTEEEWRARVAGLGYDSADVEILFETLAAAQAATAAKSAAKSTAPATTTAPAAAAAGG